MKIKKGDNVIILAGKDKGKTAKVLKSLPSVNKVVVEGVNIAKKHSKRASNDKHGQIVDKTMPIHVSNVAVLDPKDKKKTKVAYKEVAGKKVRIAKRSGQEIK